MRTWVVACAVAEGIGMTASAAAARGSDSVGTGAAFFLVLSGGLVEGAALGLFQAGALRGTLGPRHRAWILATVVAAGLGWAAGSIPATLSRDDGGPDPALGLVLLGALGIGLALGPALGLAQALVLRTRVRHPYRWVLANAAGWSVAMPLIFLGATTAGADWTWPALVAYAALTGLAAGAALGLVTGAWLPTLDGPPLRHRLVLGSLVLRRVRAGAGLTGLSVTGIRSGRVFRFPVQTAPLGTESLVVFPGHAERKSWWRNLRGGAVVQVLDRGTWSTTSAFVLDPGSLEWSVARAAYTARWPRVSIIDGPLVVLALVPEPDHDLQDQGPTPPGPAAVAGPRSRI